MKKLITHETLSRFSDFLFGEDMILLEVNLNVLRVQGINVAQVCENITVWYCKLRIFAVFLTMRKVCIPDRQTTAGNKEGRISSMCCCKK